MSCAVKCKICKREHRRQVIEAMPFPCKILLPNSFSVLGRITGKECLFPHAVFDSVNQHIDVEVSWELAYRILIGSSEHVII